MVNFYTVTFDNSEFTLLNNVSRKNVYFDHPYFPWEDVPKDNTYGLLRGFFSRKTIQRHIIN